MHWIINLVFAAWLASWPKPAAAQDYAIAKLKLFPDREEVLIKDVTRDSLGFIWFLTNGEIYRYDGYRSLDILKTIADQRPMDDIPQRIIVDHRNRLWMVGNTSLSYLDLKTWKVHPVDSTLLPPVRDRTVYWVKKVSDSAVMVAYENGHLLLLEGDRCTRIDGLYGLGVGANNNKVLPRSATWWKGKYWVGTTVGTLFSIDPQRGYRIEYHALYGVSNVIMSLIAQQNGLILDVYEQGAFRFQGADRLDKVVMDGFMISPDKFNVLQQGGRIHVYADEESACILDTNLRVLQRLAIPSVHRFRTASVNIVGNEVLLGNEEGIFVVYPKTKGLSHLNPVNPGANKSTRGIYAYPDGAIFYGTYNGAGYIESDGRTYTFQGLRHAYVMLPMNDNDLLIGTEGGFLKIFDRRKRKITDLKYTLSADAKNLHAFNLPGYVFSLAQTDTDFLIGGTNGLWLLDKKTFVLSRFEASVNGTQVSDLQVRHIRLADGGRVLLSTNLGLFEIDHQTLTKRYPQSGNLGVYKSLVVGDTLWLATQGKGLVAIDGQGRTLQAFTTATERLSNNLVYSLEYAEGTLVAGTADGLNLIKGHQIRRIGTAEGLNQTEFNSGASFWDASKKRLYIGGLMGYTVLDMTQRWFETGNQLESYVTEIYTSTRNSGEKKADYTWPYCGERTLVLNPGQSLTGLYVGTPQNYRADGRVKYALNAGEWEELRRGQFISLIGPSPGDYHIRLDTRSTGTEGRQKEFTIVKRPYYYETWWFKSLIVLSAMSLVLLWYRSRLEKIRREQDIRNRIAADLHDEVGSSLTRIFLQAATLSATQGLGDKEDKQLQLIADTSKHALLTMSDMVWSIDSRFDTMKDLVIRMKDYAYRLREEIDFSYRFEEFGNIESAKVSQAVRQNLFLIFKESLTNAIKYGDGSKIFISLHIDSVIRLIIANRYTGNQTEVDYRQGGRGRENMEQRAAKVGGKLLLTEDDGMFQVMFELPPKRGI
ncbi:sensor histidine kinase [Dyadobacter aurulentus]|uniref:sensor histidine kinase n=1 Tax=Dyadobacter sp. UC 10 TaxID=2605428 RepID=UPI001788BF19|nr:histidine kinase [Dyadobacter sp. UC 10]